MNPDLVKVDDVIDDKWTVTDVLGRGTYGQVYRAKKEENDDVAIKVENRLRKRQYLHIEAEIMTLLSGCVHVCDLYASGVTDNYYYITMQLLGKSLGVMFRDVNGPLDANLAVSYTQQMLAALISLHEVGFVHRDVKPANFALGIDGRTVFMLDFGLARRHRDLSGQLVPPRPIASFQGTITYASRNAHNRIEMGPHDDMWSLFYIVIHFVTGELPWADVTDKAIAGEMKAACDHGKLCEGVMPTMARVLDHLNTLDYSSTPNYDLIHKMITLSTKTSSHC